MIGTTINQRYEIKSELGQGGMGVVYRANDTLLKRDVAIKVVSHESLGSGGRARLLHEAQHVANLNHPNIVTVFDAGEYDSVPFIVMELVEGQTLYESKPGDLETILNIARDICSALQHAHAQGIIHRDIKPENVVLAPNGTAKLMDFGIAFSAASRLTEEGTILGTVFYISPEQALGKQIDPRADLYALGVLVYELVCGRLPFEADDPLAVITQHLNAPVVPPRAKNEAIPVDLDHLIVRLMAKQPEDRPGSAAEVLEILENIIAGSMPGAVATAPVQQDKMSALERIVSGRMAGRSAELEKARSLWREAASGQGQLLLISGEPGIGKTRMVQELVTQAQITGGIALVGRSYAEWDPPYGPIRQILRDAVRGLKENKLELPEEVWGDLVRIAPELRADFPDLPESPPGDPRTEQGRLLDQVLLIFHRLSDLGPVLLLLEDAHWSDYSTLSLLRHLARNTRAQKMMILVTYREVELDEARSLHEILLDFNREKLGVRIKLNRLTRQETQDMLAILLAEEITPEFLDSIYRETDGNPFFVEEVSKALVESGKLVFQDGRWDRPSIEEMGVPQSIQVAIQSRLRALPEAAQEVLEQAAILGREFDFRTLSHAAKTDEDSLLDALDEAIYARMVEETGRDKGGSFGFIHALIPTAIVGGLRTLHRRRLHKRAARALEIIYPEAYEALAYHCIEAGEVEKGVDSLIQAGDRARDGFAHQEAIDNYRQALDYLKEEGAWVRAARTSMKLGLTYHNVFQFPESRQAYDEGFNLWQRGGQREKDETLPPAPHAFRGFTAEPVSIDPGLNTDGWSVQIIKNLFSGLVALNANLEVVPEVAHRWEVLDDGRRYLFYLRDDWTWSDGAPVTAHDFEFAWKRVLDPAINVNDNSLYVIKNARAFHQRDLKDPEAVGIHAHDALTLEIELERPYNAFLYLLAGENPVPRHILQEHGDNWTDSDVLVTNGPFRLAEWEPGKSLLLEANPTYKGHFPGNLKQVEMLFFPGDRLGGPEANQMGKRLYQDDGVDMLWVDPNDLYHFARSQYPAEFRTAPFLMTSHLEFNTRRPPFDDPRVRRALALAIDREHLANSVWDGKVFPATGGYLPPGMPGHSEGIALPYAPPQARRLLADAGYPDGHGFPVIEAGFRGKFLEFLQHQWKDNLGIEIKGRNLSGEELIEIESTNPQYLLMLALGYMSGFPDPYQYLRRVIRPGLRIGWRHDAFEELLEKASEMTDYAKGLKMYQRADQILVKESPIIPIAYARTHVLVKPWVRRFPISPLSAWHWKEIILEAH